MRKDTTENEQKERQRESTGVGKHTGGEKGRNET